MNENDIQKIYAIFFVALSVLFLQTNFTTIIKAPIAPNKKGVCLQNTSKFHSYHLKYG